MRAIHFEFVDSLRILVVLLATFLFFCNSLAQAVHVYYVISFGDTFDLYLLLELLILRMSAYRVHWSNGLVFKEIFEAGLDHYISFPDYSLLVPTIKRLWMLIRIDVTLRSTTVVIGSRLIIKFAGCKLMFITKFLPIICLFFNSNWTAINIIIYIISF